jgi:large subunit ribosomal protein L35
MKTHRAGAKRYKVTANGKILRRKAGKSHLLTHKSPSQKRRISGMTEASQSNIDKIMLELPYIKYSR